MSVRVLTERLVMPGRERAVFSLLKQLQAEAIKARGFVSSKAFRDGDDPNKILVLSEWHDRSSWNEWTKVAGRSKIIDELFPHLYGATTHRVFLPIREEMPLL